MTSFETLAKLVNCGILFVAALVASSVLLRRYLPPPGAARKTAPVLIRYWLVVAFSIGAGHRFHAVATTDPPCIMMLTVSMNAAASAQSLEVEQMLVVEQWLASRAYGQLPCSKGCDAFQQDLRIDANCYAVLQPLRAATRAT